MQISGAFTAGRGSFSQARPKHLAFGKFLPESRRQ
jgi:hypothetical protein